VLAGLVSQIIAFYFIAMLFISVAMMYQSEVNKKYVVVPRWPIDVIVRKSLYRPINSGDQLHVTKLTMSWKMH